MYPLAIDAAATTRRIEAFIAQQLDEFERDGAILGLSGGIDSATVAVLAVRALGADRVRALLLPERDSSPQSREDALRVIEQLGIRHETVDLTPILSAIGIYKSLPLRFLVLRRVKEAAVRHEHERYAHDLGETPFLAGLLGTRGKAHRETLNAGLAYSRVKHRVRMVVSHYHAEMDNLLVLGTTNRTEAMSGLVVKWGDNVADIEPILPLYKTQVRQLARYLGVPQVIIDKAPTPDLLPGITDEYAFGLSYQVLDQILWGLEQGYAPARIVEDVEVTDDEVVYVQELVRRSEHMRNLPPVPVL